jgi:hypothetical protein
MGKDVKDYRAAVVLKQHIGTDGITSHPHGFGMNCLYPLGAYTMFFCQLSKGHAVNLMANYDIKRTSSEFFSELVVMRATMVDYTLVYQSKCFLLVYDIVKHITHQPSGQNRN